MTDEPKTAETRHTSSDVWRVISDQGKSIVALQTGVARLESRFEGGFSQLSAQLQAFSSTIDRVARPADVKGWIAVALSITLILGSIGITTVLPIRERTHTNYEELRELSRVVHYSRGLADGRSVELDRAIDSIQRRLEALERDSL